MPSACPQGVHITKRRGVYHWRRRLPGQAKGEIMVSLRTRRYREAEHLAAVADDGFAREWERLALSEKRVDREELKRILRARIERDIHGDQSGARTGLVNYPLRLLKDLLSDQEARMKERSAHGMVQAEASELLEQHQWSLRDRHMVELGLLEADVVATRGAIELVDGGALQLVLEAPKGSPTPPTETTASPLASTFVDDHFASREASRTNLHSVNQERDTVRLFLEICGDRPFQDYTRANIVDFLATLRRLPVHRGRSPTDKALSVAEIIAKADTSGAKRVGEDTVKRHLSALTQFFGFARDRSQITRSHLDEILRDHGFKRGSVGAREQRDQWTSEELVKLFASPWWSGRKSKTKHTEPGSLVERDHRFWLPLLALFHGARLEELADLYGRDIRRDDESGIWAIHIQPSEGNPGSGRRTLKNRSARRVVPIHPEIIRLGFLEYVRQTAPDGDDPLFPELEPQGVSRRRGARFTRDFVYYRQQIGLYQAGKGMHSFRHTVETRLMDEALTEQHKRHIRFILGHAGPSDEGSQRYDKGPGLQAKAETLAMLRYPELDLSRLYVEADRPNPRLP